MTDPTPDTTTDSKDNTPNTTTNLTTAMLSSLLYFCSNSESKVFFHHRVQVAASGLDSEACGSVIQPKHWFLQLFWQQVSSTIKWQLRVWILKLMGQWFSPSICFCSYSDSKLVPPWSGSFGFEFWSLWVSDSAQAFDQEEKKYKKKKVNKPKVPCCLC